MTAAQLTEIRAEFHGSRLVCEQVVGLFNLLSNKVRFRIVCMLLHGEACVQEIADVIAAGNMSNISQQLRMLRLAGVVVKRRDKKQNVYRLNDERLGRLVAFLRCEYLEPSRNKRK
jgi:DNA-binding transcriptional ArsR family regulator